jgi:hypothetical protein
MKLLAQITLPNNPLPGFEFWKNGGKGDTLVGDLTSRIMTFAIVAAGLYFFVRLISSGYGYLTSLGDPAKVASSTKELTNAIVGLVIVVTAFFIMQLLQSVLGIKII